MVPVWGKANSGESFDGMLKSRRFNIVWVGKQKPVAFDLNRKADATITYEGKMVEVARY